MVLGLTPLVIARLLGVEKYGIYALVTSLVGVVAGTSSLGQNAALQKFLPEYAIKDPARGRAILVASVKIVAVVIGVVSAALLIASPVIARVIYRDASLSDVLRFAALLVAGTVLYNHFSSVAIGLHRVQTYGTASVARGGAFLVFGALGAWLLGLYGALVGQVIGVILTTLILIFDSHRTAARRLPGEIRSYAFSDLFREIMNFGIPALLAGVVVSFGVWWGSTVLVRHSGFQQLGLFAAAYSLMQLILVLPSSLSMPAISYLAETRAVRGEAAFSELVSDNLRLIWVLTLPISFSCALFSRPLMTLMFGRAFAPASALFCWMSITALVIAINAQIGYAVASLGRMWQALALNALWLASFVPLSHFGVQGRGATGLVAAYCLSYVLFTFMVGAYSIRYLGVRYTRVRFLTLITLMAVAAAVFSGMFLDSVPFLFGRLGLVVLLFAAEWRWVLRADERLRARELLEIACSGWWLRGNCRESDACT